MIALTIRRAVPADAAAIFSVHMAAISELAASHYSAAQLAAWRGDRSPVSYAGPIGDGAIVVAVDSSHAIVGFGQLNRAAATVDAVYVSPASSRAGVGRALLAALEQAARAAGLPALSLDASLNAEAFYAACGYRVVGRADHELRPGVVLPCVRMSKLLAGMGTGAQDG